MPTASLDEINRLKKLETQGAETPPEVMAVETQRDSALEDIVILPDGRTMVKQKLTGKDFLEFQDAIAGANGKSVKFSRGMESLALKMFVWSTGQPLTVDQLLDANDDSIGFEGMSVLSEHMTALFTTPPAAKPSSQLAPSPTQG